MIFSSVRQLPSPHLKETETHFLKLKSYLSPSPPPSPPNRPVPCSIKDLFNFCWTLFVYTKGKPASLIAYIIYL